LDHFRRGHAGSGISGGDDAVNFTVALHPAGDADGGIFFSAERFGGGVVHGNDFACMVDLERQAVGVRMESEFALEHILFADENDLDVEGRDGSDCSFDLGLGGVIAAHGVNRDRGHRDVELLFSDFDDFAAFIFSAVRANAMGQFGLVAIGALGQNGPAQRVVRAAGGGAALGVTSFWIRHLFP
jgi:hypothetical protein